VKILLQVGACSSAFGGNLARSHHQGPALIATKLSFSERGFSMSCPITLKLFGSVRKRAIFFMLLPLAAY